jgi:hypothetical protein
MLSILSSILLYIIIFLIFWLIYDWYLYFNNNIIFFGPSSSGKTTLFFKIYEQFKFGINIQGCKILLTTEDIETKKFLDNIRSSNKDIHWPPKTVNVGKHLCEIKVCDFSFERVCDFHFFDWPGEVFNNFASKKNDKYYLEFVENLKSSNNIIITVDPTEYFNNDKYRKTTLTYFELFKEIKDLNIYKNKNISIVFTKKDEFESIKNLNQIISVFLKDAEISNILEYFNSVKYFYLNSYTGVMIPNSSIMVPQKNWDPTAETPEITMLVKNLISHLTI